jgi:cell division protein FtsI (penicillin-binding protein 3)
VNIRKSILLRVRVAFLAFFIFGFAIVYRIVQIQFIEGEKWRKMADEIGLQYRKIKATRGNIYSDNGSLLLTSLPFYRLSFDPTVASDELFKKEIDSLSLLLSRFFQDKKPSDYKRMIESARLRNREYIVLNRQEITYQNKKNMAKWPIFRHGRLKGGIIFEKIDKRFYPFTYLGYRTIGYINQSNEGAGLEYSFNQYLAGRDGEALFRKVAGGRWRQVYNGTEIRPDDGVDILTTLDVNLQDVAQSALLKALEEHEADNGCVIVMEVKTGEIKAMANLSRTSSGKYAERYNYAVGSQGLTEPGSTFKLASIITLLEETDITLEDSIDTGKGEFKYYDRIMPDHKPGGFGMITVKDAFAKSSNIGISRLVYENFGTRPQRFIDHLKRMGLGKPIGFQMVGEGHPYLKDTTDKTWSGVSLPWISIGHELTMTPLQTLTYFNAVANDGVMIQPIIVKATLKAGVKQQVFDSRILNKKICSEKTLEEVKLLLRAVVTEGTASNIRNSSYPIAGKTGTSQKLIDGRYTRKYYTSFAGYFPADDPKYSCIAVIDNPKGFRQYGSDVAAPVFKEISDNIYARDLDLHKPMPSNYYVDYNTFPVIRAGNMADLQMICNFLGISNHAEKEFEWVRTRTVGNAIQWVSSDTRHELVPNVEGLTLRDAVYLLENEGLKVYYTGKGRVVKQSQAPGSNILEGSTIKLELKL